MSSFTTKSALTVSTDYQIHIFLKGRPNGGGQGRSIGLCCASLHAYGGAFYSVTCIQRKYHCRRGWIVAYGPAKGRSRRGVARSCLPQTSFLQQTIPAHPPPGSASTEREWQPYSVMGRGLSPRRNAQTGYALLRSDKSHRCLLCDFCLTGWADHSSLRDRRAAGDAEIFRKHNAHSISSSCSPSGSR